MNDKNIKNATKSAKSKVGSRTAGRKSLDPKIREFAIDAARKAIEAKGLDGLTARLVAQRAGISVGSLYNFFGDMDELIRLVNARAYDELSIVENTALNKAREDGKDPREQMLALALAYLDYVESHQSHWLSVLSFNRARTEPPPRWYLEKELGLLRIIEECISVLPAAQDQKTRHVTARALWASIHGIVTIAVADGFLMQPINDVRRQIEIVVNAVARSLENKG